MNCFYWGWGFNLWKVHQKRKSQSLLPLSPFIPSFPPFPFLSPFVPHFSPFLFPPSSPPPLPPSLSTLLLEVLREKRQLEIANRKGLFGPAPLQKYVGEFCRINFGGFCQGFPGGFFWALFPTKMSYVIPSPGRFKGIWGNPWGTLREFKGKFHIGCRQTPSLHVRGGGLCA